MEWEATQLWISELVCKFLNYCRIKKTIITCCPCSWAWSSIFLSLSFIFSWTLPCWSDWLSKSSSRVKARWSRSLSSSFCLRSWPLSFLSKGRKIIVSRENKVKKQILQFFLLLIIWEINFAKLKLLKNYRINTGCISYYTPVIFIALF